MTFGQRTAEKLRSAKRASPSLGWDEVANIIQAEFDALTFEAKREKMTPREKMSGLFDALASSCGQNTKELPRAMLRAVGVALSDIRAVTPDVSPEEIERRAGCYRQKHRDWPLTAPALAKYWGEFGAGHTRTGKIDPYVEPPSIWREVAKALFPDAKDWINPHDFDAVKWADVRLTLGPQILKSLP